MGTDGKARQRITAGCRVGKLLVEQATPERHSRYTVWRCRCDCGGELLLDTRSLQRGSVTDCGCMTKVGPGQLELTGQRFGKLVCIDPTERRGTGGDVVWLCRCDCGRECTASVGQLRAGNKKSCGCLSRSKQKDYAGKTFGQLTVLEYAGKSAGMHLWKCRCSCGTETVVGQTLLQSGKTKSCGCLQAGQIVENLKLCCGTSVTMLEASLRKGRAGSATHYPGVYQSKKTGKWIARITFRGKTYYLGSYGRQEDAVKARRQGEEMYEDFLQRYYDRSKVKK